MNFVHLPSRRGARSGAGGQLSQAVTNPSNQPAFIHCASANRAAALWLIKRVEVDRWDVDRASEEASALGLTNPALKTYALEQLQARKK